MRRHAQQWSAAAALAAAGIPCAPIGEVLAPGEGRWLVAAGRPGPLPTFARDEIARFFEARPPTPRTPD